MTNWISVLPNKFVMHHFHLKTGLQLSSILCIFITSHFMFVDFNPE
ncbi:unnamed protein product, partial [Amoebophrya sp. A120]|eukprot:GSA120T00023889001.1